MVGSWCCAAPMVGKLKSSALEEEPTGGVDGSEEEGKDEELLERQLSVDNGEGEAEGICNRAAARVTTGDTMTVSHSSVPSGQVGSAEKGARDRSWGERGEQEVCSTIVAAVDVVEMGVAGSDEGERSS